ncbi:MAG TPA: peptidoglycan editing factor PgeF [Clostridiales bacterium]|nr:MAG: hypothetical protein A2Y18_08635 [Clostridiales bacterium GWD2_32_19]HCC07166.1 peptidoglycan editing factor PgeF [Clostridiales bacterium]
MIKKDIKFETENNVKYVKFGIFDEYQNDIISTYSTKIGGVSNGIYESMNLNFYLGDSEENVLENYKIYSNAIGVDYTKLVFSDQCHNNNIRIVTEDDIGKGIIKEKDYQDIDGLITNIKGIGLVTLHADCAPLYFYDPIKKVIGLAHAGWKGTAMEIAGKMIDVMKNNFGTNPEDLLVAVGPSICGKCYEIGEEVKEEFDKMSIDVSEYISFDEKSQKYFPDISLINRKLVIDKGVKPENVTVSDICTMTNLDIFFSHRGHKGKRGSQAAVMQLKIDANYESTIQRR